MDHGAANGVLDDVRADVGKLHCARRDEAGAVARHADHAIFLENDDVKAPKRKITSHAATGWARANNHDVVDPFGHVRITILARQVYVDT